MLYFSGDLPHHNFVKEPALKISFTYDARCPNTPNLPRSYYYCIIPMYGGNHPATAKCVRTASRTATSQITHKFSRRRKQRKIVDWEM